MKRMNMFLASSAALAALLIGTSCSGNSQKADDSVDSQAVVEDTVNIPAAPADSLAAIFCNPAKASENPTDSTYATTASGLKYMILKEGTGASPKATDEVTVHYEGKLTDGTVFDSSYSRGEPAAFPLNRVIAGWTEGLQLMKTGGKAVFYIPSNLGYGPDGTPGGPIPPNADLIFTVELLQIN